MNNDEEIARAARNAMLQHYAGLAMQGLAERHILGEGGSVHTLAAIAFDIAKAMVKEAKKCETEEGA